MIPHVFIQKWEINLFDANAILPKRTTQRFCDCKCERLRVILAANFMSALLYAIFCVQLMYYIDLNMLVTTKIH